MSSVLLLFPFCNNRSTDIQKLRVQHLKKTNSLFIWGRHISHKLSSLHVQIVSGSASVIGLLEAHVLHANCRMMGNPPRPIHLCLVVVVAKKSQLLIAMFIQYACV